MQSSPKQSLRFKFTLAMEGDGPTAIEAFWDAAVGFSADPGSVITGDVVYAQVPGGPVFPITVDSLVEDGDDRD